jgi:hypothetical protein
MRVLRDRLEIGVGGSPARIRAGGIPVSDLVGRLQEAGSPVKLLAQGSIEPLDLIAALAQGALGDDDAPGPALVQTKPRASALARVISEPAWVAVFPAAAHRDRLTVAAGLLQIYDFWDASHDAAQKADDLGERDVSAYWHGIAHRREPDAGNAAYWFRRVGKHPVFKPLAEEARPILESQGDGSLSAKLFSGGTWNASAMIDACCQAKPGSPSETILRRLQRREMWLLLEATVAPIAG